MNERWESLTPLKENNDVPLEEEVEPYAEYLGLTLPQDAKYLPLVREALRAPLPHPWQACESPEGELLYRNTLTREVTPDHPLDQLYRDRIFRLKSAQLTVESIEEASYLKEQSYLQPSSLKEQSYLQPSSLRKSSLLHRNITEESFLSQPSHDHAQQLLQQHQYQLRLLKQRIMQFVPKQQDLITSDSYNRSDTIKLQKLAALRLQVQKKTAILKQLQREREEKEKIYSQLIG